MSFADRATRYAADVVAGRIIACKWHRLACQRHLADIDRGATNTIWPYTFNPELTDASG